jgi:hypothetical protein
VITGVGFELTNPFAGLKLRAERVGFAPLLVVENKELKGYGFLGIR